jgi:hypothetical protein
MPSLHTRRCKSSWMNCFALLTSGLAVATLSPGCGRPIAANSGPAGESGAVPTHPAIAVKCTPATAVNKSDSRDESETRPPVVARKPVRRAISTNVAKSNHPPQNEMLHRLAARLHHEALTHFYSDPSNGVSRLPLVYERIVRKWTTPYFSPGELGTDDPIPSRNDLRKIHRSSLKDFSTRTPPATTPPQPRFGRTANIHWKTFDRNRKVWEVNSLDLIGLIKHPRPVAYVSEKLPEMNKLHAVPTRDLDEFEYSGLSLLESGKDLYARSDKGVIRLLGAVRAKTSCLACHTTKKEGDLLGVFSYTLREAQYKRSVKRFLSRRPVLREKRPK